MDYEDYINDKKGNKNGTNNNTSTFEQGVINDNSDLPF